MIEFKSLNPQMSRNTLILLAAALAWTSAAPAALVTYTDRISFDAAAGPTTLEDFNDLTSNGTFTGPLDATTSNAIVSPGEIVPGLTLQSSGGSLTSEIIVPGSYWISSPLGESLELLFQPGTRAVGFDLGLALAGRILEPTSTFPQLVQVFDGSDNLLASLNNTQAFLGWVSDSDDIRRISMSQILGAGVDNVAFGAGPDSGPLPTPEPATWALLLAGVGLLAVRRRRP